MSMTDRGNGGQHFCVSCTCNRILSERPQRKDTGHTTLQATLDFSGFVLRAYMNSRRRPKRKRHFGPQIGTDIKIARKLV